MKEKDGEWALPSGVWVQTNESFSLTKTARGRSVSAHASPADIATVVGSTFEDQTPRKFYPPEFHYSPLTGKPLGKPPSNEAAGWAPPFGNASIDAGGSSDARGLRRTQHSLSLRNIKSRTADKQPDDSMDVPPPGEYQFFSVPFGERGATLIALDPLKGTLFARLPASCTWQPLEGVGPAIVDECSLPHHAWRAELAKCGTDPGCTLFVATQAGLARIAPDIASLTYEVTYIGGAPAVGAPIAFDNQIWIPLQAKNGQIRFVGVNSVGELKSDLTVVGPEGATIDVSEIGLPVSYGRVAIWVCKTGQLRVQKQSDGGAVATFLQWPPNLLPRLDFGSPYLTSSGQLWQVCFNTVTNQYDWVRIDSAHAEISTATTLRLCSGMVNFRITSKTSMSPWEEPEHTDDTSSNDFVIPLLESSTSDVVVGLRLSSEAGIAQAFESKERMPYALCYDDSDNDVTFFTAYAPEPWRIRLFVHSGKLWAYHSRAKRIEGWDLA
jgi:hypothetical protein